MRVRRNVLSMWIGAGLVVAAGLAFWLGSGSRPAPQGNEQRGNVAGGNGRRADGDAGKEPSNGARGAAATAENGGVAADASAASTDAEPFVAPPIGQEPARNFLGNVGLAPLIAGETNEQTKAVAEALRNKTNPERVSVAVVPKPFDLEAYKKNPTPYLKAVEPSRVYQAAQPGPKVPQLFPVGEAYHTIKQGESALLKVQALPGAPVTFTSFDMGAFENHLATITVQADDSGVAQAKLTGTPGTFNNVNILAASPLTSGQVKFTVFVTLAGIAGK